MSVPTYTKAGNKSSTLTKLDKDVFSVTTDSHELLKAAYVAHLANGRGNYAQTLKRGEVRGGGRKPWRQKGTGRARFGSTRNPIWRGGGITFGPTGDENYSHKLHTKAKRQAIRQALSLAADENRIIILEAFDSKEAKVAPIIKLLDKIGAKGNILLVVNQKGDSVEKATRNIAGLKVVQANYLNTYNILNADSVVISREALPVISEWLGKAKTSQAKAKTEKA